MTSTTEKKIVHAFSSCVKVEDIVTLLLMSMEVDIDGDNGSTTVRVVSRSFAYI